MCQQILCVENSLIWGLSERKKKTKSGARIAFSCFSENAWVCFSPQLANELCFSRNMQSENKLGSFVCEIFFGIFSFLKREPSKEFSLFQSLLTILNIIALRCLLSSK